MMQKPNMFLLSLTRIIQTNNPIMVGYYAHYGLVMAGVQTRHVYHDDKGKSTLKHYATLSGLKRSSMVYRWVRAWGKRMGVWIYD